MWNFFRRDSNRDSDSFPIGGEVYKEFRRLSEKHGNLGYFSEVCMGARQLPIGATDDVRKMVNLAQTLISYTELSVTDIIKIAKRGKWVDIESRLDRIGVAIAPKIASNRTSLEKLKEWADEMGLPEFSPYDSSAYQVTGFPRDIAAIYTLRQLHIPECNVGFIPEELSVLPALESICIDNNSLKSLPSSLFKLPSLRRIDAEGNEIDSIPDSVGLAKHLQQLDLDGNAITSISPNISKCSSLTRLNLRNQRHSSRLDSAKTPISDEATNSLISLERRGVEIRY